MAFAMDFDRVEVRLPVRSPLNPRLKVLFNTLHLRYDVERGDMLFTRAERLHEWADGDRTYYLSNRPNEFTVPGGFLHIYKLKDNQIQEEGDGFNTRR